MTFAAVLAVLVALGPVLELDAAAINALAPLIHQRLLQLHGAKAKPTRAQVQDQVRLYHNCYHFRCDY